MTSDMDGIANVRQVHFVSSGTETLNNDYFSGSSETAMEDIFIANTDDPGDCDFDECYFLAAG